MLPHGSLCKTPLGKFNEDISVAGSTMKNDVKRGKHNFGDALTETENHKTAFA